MARDVLASVSPEESFFDFRLFWRGQTRETVRGPTRKKKRLLIKFSSLNLLRWRGREAKEASLCVRWFVKRNT